MPKTVLNYNFRLIKWIKQFSNHLFIMILKININLKISNNLLFINKFITINKKKELIILYKYKKIIFLKLIKNLKKKLNVLNYLIFNINF